jgi:hypothetical protein
MQDDRLWRYHYVRMHLQLGKVHISCLGPCKYGYSTEIESVTRKPTLVCGVSYHFVVPTSVSFGTLKSCLTEVTEPPKQKIKTPTHDLVGRLIDPRERYEDPLDVKQQQGMEY